MAWGFCLTIYGAPAQPPPSPGWIGAAPLTLQNALGLARVNSEPLLAVETAARLAAEDRIQARAALLPSMRSFTQYVYTQPNGTPSAVFIGNDGPHVYNMWGTVHGDLFAPAKWADYRSAAAAEAVARATAEVTARGLVATVVEHYYDVVATARRVANAREALADAQEFLDLTEREERNGAGAHSDVAKAQVHVVKRQREAQEAELAALKSHTGLAVLIFPDYRETFAVVDDLQDVMAPPLLDEVRRRTMENNPDLRVAEFALRQASASVQSARSGYLPSISFDYFYGINANQFAAQNPEGQNLLGSVTQAQVAVPLWNWGTVQSRVRQAQLRVQQAHLELSLTQRQLLANINAFYAEAQTAYAQIDSLRSSLDLATESLRLTRLRYQARGVSVLEVVDAQLTLIQARDEYNNGLVRYRVALAALQTLTGSL